AKFAKQSADALKIAEPVQVSEVFYYKDGGTIGIVLTDAKGVMHSFCLDGRKEAGKSTGNLFVGATYPNRKGAKMVDARGAEESPLYGVMLRWANKHPQRDALYNEKSDLNAKEFGNLWEIRAFFLRLDARFVRK